MSVHLAMKPDELRRLLDRLERCEARMGAIKHHRYPHGIVPLDGRCAVCDRTIRETNNDYRGPRFRHTARAALNADEGGS